MAGRATRPNCLITLHLQVGLRADQVRLCGGAHGRAVRAAADVDLSRQQGGRRQRRRERADIEETRQDQAENFRAGPRHAMLFIAIPPNMPSRFESAITSFITKMITWPPIRLGICCLFRNLENFVDYPEPHPVSALNRHSISICVDAAVIGNVVFNAHRPATCSMKNFLVPQARGAGASPVVHADPVPVATISIPAYPITAKMSLLNTYFGLAFPMLSTIVCIFVFKAAFEAVPSCSITTGAASMARRIAALILRGVVAAVEVGDRHQCRPRCSSGSRGKTSCCRC